MSTETETIKCDFCKDNLQTVRYLNSTNGKPICRTCMQGVKDGLEVFAQYGVVGETTTTEQP